MSFSGTVNCPLVNHVFVLDVLLLTPRHTETDLVAHEYPEIGWPGSQYGALNK